MRNAYYVIRFTHYALRITAPPLEVIMIKNIVLGSLFGLIAIGLVIGGVNRSREKFAQAAEANEPLNRQTAAQDYDHDHDHEWDDAPVSWETMTAVVYEQRPNGLWLRGADGRELRIRRAAWEYAQSLGFTAVVGDNITLTGYQSGADFEIGLMRHNDNGQEIALRDANGRALWSGADH
jgi:hypothetical protein